MNINFFPLLPLFLAGMILLGVYRFWVAVDRLGLRRELMWRDGGLVQLHTGIVAVGVVLAGYCCYAIAAPAFEVGHWTQDVIAALLTALLVGFAKHARLEVAWFRVRELVFRTVAMHQLITAAELAHALRVSDEYEAAQRAGRPYDLDENRVIDVTPEIQK